LAQKYHEEAISIYDASGLLDDRTVVALNLADLARALVHQHEFRKNSDVLARLAKTLPETPVTQSIATRLNDLGFELFEAGQLPEASHWLQKSLVMRRQLESDGLQVQQHLERTLSHLGRTLEALRDYEHARVYFQQLLALQRALYPPETFPESHDHLVATLRHLGTIQEATRDLSAARTYCEEAFAMHTRLRPEGESAETDAARALLLSKLKAVPSAAGQRRHV
jgi:tetratricopeptide (TPR) repeat protein